VTRLIQPGFKTKMAIPVIDLGIWLGNCFQVLRKRKVVVGPDRGWAFFGTSHALHFQFGFFNFDRVRGKRDMGSKFSIQGTVCTERDIQYDLTSGSKAMGSGKPWEEAMGIRSFWHFKPHHECTCCAHVVHMCHIDLTIFLAAHHYFTRDAGHRPLLHGSQQGALTNSASVLEEMIF